MALFPETRSATAGTQTSNATSWTLSYPGAGDILDGGGTAISAGDLIVVNVGRDGSSGTQSISGFTTLFDAAGDGACKGGTFVKVATGSESGTFTYTPGASEQGAWRVFVVKNWYGAIANGVEAGGSAQGTSVSADPGSFSPSWGSGKAYWRASCAHDGGAVTISSYPSGYNIYPNSDESGGGNGAGMGAAGITADTATVDPGTFILSASEQWVAWTIAVRASTANASVTGTDSGSGSDSAAVIQGATKSGTDSGSGSDSATVGTASLTATDTGAGSEASSLVASATATDSGSGVDASALAVSLAVTDAGVAADSGTASVPVAATDTGAGSETSTLAAAYALTDTGAGTDTAAVGVASLTATDSGTDVESGTATSGTKQTSIGEVSLDPSGDPGDDTNHTIHIRARTTTGSGGTMRVALFEGASNRSGWLETSALSTSLTDYLLPIPAASAANISNYGDLSLQFYGYHGAGQGLVFEVAEMYLVTPLAPAGNSVTGTDSGSGAEVSSLAASITATGDTGSGAEASALAASITATESGAGAETSSLAASLTATADAGVGTDASTLAVPVATTDSGAGTDASSVLYAIPGYESSTGTEASSLAAVLARAETGSGSFLSALTAALGRTDSGSATESASATSAGGPSGTDSGSGVDSSALTVSFDDGIHASFPSGSWTPMDFNAGAATASSVATTSNSNWYGGPYWVDQGDGSWFQGPVDVSSYGEDLRLLSWGFAATQKPRWVIVEFEWTQTHNGSYAGLGIQLTKNGGSTAYKNASIGGPEDEGYPSRIIFDVFGTLTPAEMNSANFGVLFYGYTAAVTSEFTVGNVRVSVVYETETATVHASTAGSDSGSGSDSATVMVALSATDTGAGTDAIGARGFIVDDLCEGIESLGSRVFAAYQTVTGVDSADAAWYLASIPGGSLALTAEGGGTLSLAVQSEGSVALSVPSENALALTAEAEDGTLLNTPIDWEPQ